MQHLSIFLTGLCLSVSLMLPAGAEPTDSAVVPVDKDHRQSLAMVLPTTDGQTTLHGQLDLPPDLRVPVPLVVMVPGSGLFDRDMHFGDPANPRSFLFRHLSAQLNQRGVATLRYDYRGVCHINAMPVCESCQTPQEHGKFFVENCFDNGVRQGVTPANMRTDILQTYRWGTAQKQIDPKRVVVLLHSEGSVHTAWLLKEKAIAPQGVVMMGGLFESPGNVIEWQMVERLQTQILQADTNGDGQVSTEELKTYQPQNDLLAMYPQQALLPPQGHWTADSLKQVLQAQYNAEKQRALQTEDSAPFGNNGTIQASMAWWKMFFRESPTLAEWFHASGLPVINHLGDRDSQISLARQQAALQALPDGHRLSIVPHPGTGHALGDHMLMGPMREDSEARLLDSVMALLR
jgi:hypothetical protein